MDFISQRLQALQPSATLAMSQKSNELKAQGVDVINLSVGEPDFFTPDHIKQAAKQAIDDNFSFYSPVPGYLSLRQAISDKLKNENNLDFAPEQIVVGNGICFLRRALAYIHHIRQDTDDGKQQCRKDSKGLQRIFCDVRF